MSYVGLLLPFSSLIFIFYRYDISLTNTLSLLCLCFPLLHVSGKTPIPFKPARGLPKQLSIAEGNLTTTLTGWLLSNLMALNIKSTQRTFYISVV